MLHTLRLVHALYSAGFRSVIFVVVSGNMQLTRNLCKPSTTKLKKLTNAKQYVADDATMCDGSVGDVDLDKKCTKVV